MHEFFNRMPRYRMQKELRALKIATVVTAKEAEQVRLTFVDSYFPPLDVDRDAVGGLLEASEINHYLVMDGESISVVPARDFDQHLTRI